MINIKAISIDKTKTTEFVLVLGLLAIAMFLPFIIHLQWITGPIINAILILVLFLGGLRLALLVSFIPSFMALSGGLLPFVLAPVVPFIILSNILYLTVINYFYHIIRKEHAAFIISIIIASIFKFLFLLSTTSIMTKLVLKQSLVSKIALIMSWPQLFTALSGGLIAFLIF
jgi:hypothetical protein